MSEFKGTKTAFKKITTIGRTQDKNAYWKSIILEDGSTLCEVKGVHYGINNKEVKFNTDLIVDAFKVRQQINCELSELLENFDSAISLLKQTTEFEVLQSFIDKVSILEKVNNLKNK